MPIEDRIVRYREQAEQALARANRTRHPEIRATLLSIAASWHLLISELERARGGTMSGTPEPLGNN